MQFLMAQAGSSTDERMHLLTTLVVKHAAAAPDPQPFASMRLLSHKTREDFDAHVEFPLNKKDNDSKNGLTLDLNPHCSKGSEL